MVKKHFFLYSLIVLFTSACGTPTYTTIPKEHLNQAFILNSSSTFKGYYYQGSDSEFHYFISKWDDKKDRYFKLDVANLMVYSPFPLYSTEIRVDLLSSEKEFGRNESYTLYQFD